MLTIFGDVVYAQLKPSVEWVKIYDGIGRSIDMTNDAKMDKEFNLYLAGRSAGVDGSQDLLILKYSRSGELISEIRYISAPASWEEANSIAVDSSGNIYSIGSASFGTSSFYAIIQKYSSEGNIIWNKIFYNTSEQYSEGQIITIDKSNNIISGYLLNGACFTKYTSSGDSLWTVSISDDTSNYTINDIITDSYNNIYSTVTQSYYAGGDVPETKVIFLKYDHNGNSVWTKSLDVDTPRKLIFDNAANLLLVTHGDGKVIKYNTEGDSLWCFDASGLLTDINIDKENNILLSGYAGGIGGTDYMISKVASDGSFMWSSIFNSDENLRDFAMAVAVDDDDNVYITGSSHDMITQGVCNTLKYNPDGELLWQYKYDAPHSIFENPGFIFLDDSNNVFIVGDVADSTNGWNFFALKITQKLGTNIEQPKSFLLTEYSLKQNYPNPFNPSTRIEFSTPKSGFVKLEIFDALGRNVAELINQYLSVGSYSVIFNAEMYSSGIYYYRLSTDEFSKINKAVLIK